MCTCVCGMWKFLGAQGTTTTSHHSNAHTLSLTSSLTAGANEFTIFTNLVLSQTSSSSCQKFGTDKTKNPNVNVVVAVTIVAANATIVFWLLVKICVYDALSLTLTTTNQIKCKHKCNIKLQQCYKKKDTVSSHRLSLCGKSSEGSRNKFCG